VGTGKKQKNQGNAMLFVVLVWLVVKRHEAGAGKGFITERARD
jgi:hypothetical protein